MLHNVKSLFDQCFFWIFIFDHFIAYNVPGCNRLNWQCCQIYLTSQETYDLSCGLSWMHALCGQLKQYWKRNVQAESVAVIVCAAVRVLLTQELSKAIKIPLISVNIITWMIWCLGHYINQSMIMIDWEFEYFCNFKILGEELPFEGLSTLESLFFFLFPP